MNKNFGISLSKELIFKKRVGSFELFSIYGEIFEFNKKKSPVEYYILKTVKSKSIIVDVLIKKTIDVFSMVSRETVLKKIENLKELGIINFQFLDNNLFTKNEIDRYKWQLEFLKKFQSTEISNFEIQNNWKTSKVTIIGLGGQGAMISQLLTAIGVGGLTLVDGDTIESSNLTRQLIYSEDDIGKFKVDILSKKLSKQNSNVNIKGLNQFINSKDEMLHLFDDQDIVILCADRPLISIREWANSCSIRTKTPYIAVSGSWVGPLCIPQETACFECEKEHYRQKYHKYDDFIKMLKKNKQMPRASFSFRPVISGSLIALQVAKYLSRVMDVEILEKKFKLDTGMSLVVEKIERNKKCKSCGNKT